MMHAMSYLPQAPHGGEAACEQPGRPNLQAISVNCYRLRQAQGFILRGKIKGNL
jgi:hypothetical protein